MGELAQVLSEIDQEEYVYSALGVIVPVAQHEQEMDSETFTQAGSGTVFDEHREALREATANKEDERAVDLAIFGGSVACLTLLRTSSAVNLLQSMAEVRAKDFSAAIRRVAAEVYESDAIDIDAMINNLTSASRALFELSPLFLHFVHDKIYSLEEANSLIVGATLFNFAVVNID